MERQNVLDALRRSGGFEAVSRQLGVPPAQAVAGAEALLPGLLSGFTRFGGRDVALGASANTLTNLLGPLGGGNLAAGVLGHVPCDTAAGQTILAALFGAGHGADEVIEPAAEASGLDPALLSRMLPLLAMLTGGYLAARANLGGGGAGVQDSAPGLGALFNPGRGKA